MALEALPAMQAGIGMVLMWAAVGSAVVWCLPEFQRVLGERRFLARDTRVLEQEA